MKKYEDWNHAYNKGLMDGRKEDRVITIELNFDTLIALIAMFIIGFMLSQAIGLILTPLPNYCPYYNLTCANCIEMYFNNMTGFLQ
jgi:hypothetical protein